MNKTLKTILIVIAILLSARLGAYLVRAVTVERQVNEITTGSTTLYAEDFKQGFMEGCLEVDFSGSGFDQKQFCGCMYDEIVADKGIQWAVKAGLNSNDPEYQSFFENYATVCLGRQNIL